MDQVKIYLAIAKREHFWILCGLAFLVGWIMYLSVSSRLGTEFTAQTNKIKGIDSALAPFESGEHANIKWVDIVHKDTDKLQNNVHAAWEKLYEKQAKILNWPQGLGADFIAAFSQPASQDNANAMLEYCEAYQRFVPSELRHMADIVDAPWLVEAQDIRRHGGHGPARGPAQATPEPGADEAAERLYTVLWTDSDESRHATNYNWVAAPSPLQVRYTQEELWVMEAVFQSIARANLQADGHPAAGPYEAAVRAIAEMVMGYDATSKFPLGEGENRIMRPARPVGPGQQLGPMGRGGNDQLVPHRPVMTAEGEQDQSYHGGVGGPGPHKGMGMRGQGMGGMPGGAPDAAGPVSPEDQLRNFRYVGEGGKPLMAADLANPPFAEYNLMAFKLTVVADERNWERLLIELANSPLRLEVRQVRLNVTGDNSGGGLRGMPHGSHGRASEGATGDTEALHNVTLEIDGVAYLINPVGINGESGAASGATPAGTSPAGNSPAGSGPAANAPAVAPPATSPPPAAANANSPTPPAAAPAASGPPGAAPRGATPAPAPAGPPAAASPAGPHAAAK